MATSISASMASFDAKWRVERRPGDPARGTQLDHGHAVEAAGREELGRGGEDLLDAELVTWARIAPGLMIVNIMRVTTPSGPGQQVPAARALVPWGG